MEQRPLRLGDIVDDYCPRERRITNHVIVALVSDGIRQTRCSTCDTEHVYKAARLPRRKPKEDDVPVAPAVADAVAAEIVAPRAAAAPPAVPPPAASPTAVAAPATAHAAPAAPAPVDEERADDIWPANRQLIRAQLPRVDGEVKEPRPIPEFTMHQRAGRGGQPYRGESWPSGNGHGRGGGGGFRTGPPGPHRDQGNGQPGAGGGHRRRRRRRGRGPKVG